MGVPTSEVGYTSATPRTRDHEGHKGHVVGKRKRERERNNLNREIYFVSRT
jgi:hypothetical protein